MNTIVEVTDTVVENSPFFVMMRIHGMVGATINQASVSGIIAKIYEISGATPEVATQTENLTVSEVIFDTLQTAGWTTDATGYNFGHVVPAAWVVKGGAHYDIEYRVTPTAGDPYYLPRVRVQTTNYLSS